MNVNPKALKNLWSIQKKQQKSIRDLLNTMTDKDKELNRPTDYVQQMNVSCNDTKMDQDLVGAGNNSLGQGQQTGGTGGPGGVTDGE